jgi:hypothetical protein
MKSGRGGSSLDFSSAKTLFSTPAMLTFPLALYLAVIP